MGIIIGIFFVLVIGSFKMKPLGEFNNNYLDKNTTTIVNGFFVILVLLSHYVQYGDFSSVWDLPYIEGVREHLKQLVVTTFLFYSGYGMMESIKKKGENYIKGIPEKFLTLLIKYDFAVLAFVALAFILGTKYPAKQILLAFTTWTAVGNSNWYISLILCMYMMIYASFSVIKRLTGKQNHVISVIVFMFMVIAYVALMIHGEWPSRYYNTAALVPVGFLYSLGKDKVEHLVKKSEISYLLSCTIMIGIYIVSFLHRDSSLVVYTIWAIAFVAIILLLTMKCELNSNLFTWAGKHVFSIYIIQRIPMIIMDKMGYIDNHKYLSLVSVMITTAVLAVCFEKTTEAVISKIKGKIRI